MLIGGAAASPAVRHVAASLFGGTVVVPTPDEYVAAGAARQAAWALYGGDAPPEWEQARAQVISADPTAAVRERDRDRRAATHPTTS